MAMPTLFASIRFKFHSNSTRHLNVDKALVNQIVNENENEIAIAI